jgi:hypothetical protein
MLLVWEIARGPGLLIFSGFVPKIEEKISREVQETKTIAGESH